MSDRHRRWYRNTLERTSSKRPAQGRSEVDCLVSSECSGCLLLTGVKEGSGGDMFQNIARATEEKVKDLEGEEIMNKWKE